MAALQDFQQVIVVSVSAIPITLQLHFVLLLLVKACNSLPCFKFPIYCALNCDNKKYIYKKTQKTLPNKQTKKQKEKPFSDDE